MVSSRRAISQAPLKMHVSKQPAQQVERAYQSDQNSGTMGTVSRLAATNRVLL